MNMRGRADQRRIMPSPLLILGQDTAAAERSAKRVGFDTTVIASADLPRALRALADAPLDAPVLVTLDAVEQASLLDAAALERRLLTPGRETVAVLRDPATLQSLPKFRGLRRAPGWFGSLLRKLLKRPAQSGEPVEAVFVADGWSVRMLGTIAVESGQLADVSEVQRAALNHVAVVLTQRHDTRGLFAIYATAHGDKKITPQRVDPAFTAAMDTLETLTKVRVVSEANRAVKARSKGRSR